MRAADPNPKTHLRTAKVFILAAVLFLNGCRTPPDMRPFADATSQLAGSIKTSGRTVVSEIDAMSARWNPQERQTAMDTAQKFSRQWTQRNALADSLLEYSASLSAIAQAGEQGEESARAVAASFKKLCASVDVALPQAAVLENTIKVGSILYGKFAQDRAAKTLGESMNRLQPVIEETVVILSNSLKQVETGLDSIRDQNAQNVEDEIFSEGGGTTNKVSGERGTLKRLFHRRAVLLEQLEETIESRENARKELLEGPNEARQKEFEHWSTLSKDIVAELAAVETSLKTGTEALAPFDARKAADRDRLTMQMALVRAVSGGLADWAAAHSRLAAAALEKKPLQVDDLVQTALEIRDLAQSVRNARKE